MLFDSWQYVLFFPAVVALHFAAPHRWRWLVLLAASYLFYACWRADYLILIAASTLVDYGAAIGLAHCRRRSARRALLALSLGTNLGLLGVFKYLGFAADSVHALLATWGIAWQAPRFDILLPVGISFYTFQTLGYTLDVYHHRLAPERHLGRFALYVSYFPQLVAGPIERARNLLPQLRSHTRFDVGRTVEGLRLILWGLFKKVVIADRLALFVDAIYDQPNEHSGPAVAAATVFFAFQIYCDFSGYSDIAIGSARVLGHDLMANFDRPYFATSIADFWRRWHISLSTWFRDYVYIPLGGGAGGTARTARNVFVVFAVSGLWHGANWTFVLWGVLHGTYYLCGRATRGLRQRLAAAVKLDGSPHLAQALARVSTFGLVCFAWLFFRADSAGDAWILCRSLGTGWDLLGSLDGALAAVDSFALARREFAGAVCLVTVLILVQLWHGGRAPAERLAEAPASVRWAIYVGLATATLNLGVVEQVPFIYFQF